LRSTPVVVRPAAEADIFAAQRWYERERRGLGRAFRLEVDAAIARLSTNPSGFAVIHRSVRRVLLRRFPFALYFLLLPDKAVVLACIHARRDPLYIRQRLR
jgi:toxin ParE1/3/4